MGTDFRRAEAELLGSGEHLGCRGKPVRIGESKVSDLDADERDLLWSRKGRELRLAHDIARPLGNLATGLLERGEEIRRALAADRERAPDGPRSRTDDEREAAAVLHKPLEFGARALDLVDVRLEPCAVDLSPRHLFREAREEFQNLTDARHFCFLAAAKTSSPDAHYSCDNKEVVIPTLRRDIELEKC